VLGVSLLLAPTLVGATPADVGALEALLTPVSTLTARFTQTVLGAHLEVLQSGEGQLRIARPGKFRWEMKAPYPQLIVANGERVYVYDEDLEQVQIKPIAEAFDGTPARVLAGETAALAAEFDVSRVESQPETFRLSPRADGAPYRELRLSFDGKVISAIDEASFAFDVPAGVDVIGDDRPTP
jgi:outer membrane lipoprotein carrier protein